MLSCLPVSNCIWAEVECCLESSQLQLLLGLLVQQYRQNMLDNGSQVLQRMY